MTDKPLTNSHLRFILKKCFNLKLAQEREQALLNLYGYLSTNESSLSLWERVGEREINLVIECDGSQHYTNEGLEADRICDVVLAQLGFKFLRFDPDHVMSDIYEVVDIILSHCI